MRTTKAVLAACAAAILGLSTVVVAGAAISGTSGQVIELTTPPASVALNKLEHATSVYAFDEKQGVTLGGAVAVDAVNPGTYTTFPSGSAKVAAGTLVDSHMIHSDIPSRSYTSHRTGSVTFANDVIGVIGSTAKLASSDSLGAAGTIYAGTTKWRGLESGENGWASADKLTISANRRTVSFDVNTYVMDEIRVITKHANPLVTTISDTPDPVQAGGNVTYTVTVTNTGASAADGVQVADSFPGATLVSATASGGCTGTTTVTCGLGTIAAGGSAAATIVVTSPSTVPAGGTITNTATSPPGQDPAATATTTVVSPSLTTSIADAPDPVTAGNDVQYILTVTNNGVAPVANAHVVDTLPAGDVAQDRELDGRLLRHRPGRLRARLARGRRVRPGGADRHQPGRGPGGWDDDGQRGGLAGHQRDGEPGHDGGGAARRRVQGLRLAGRLAHHPRRRPRDAVAAEHRRRRSGRDHAGRRHVLRRSRARGRPPRSRSSPATATRTSRSRSS